MKQFKLIVKRFAGVALLIFAAVGAITYFSDLISVGNFTAFAFVVATAVLVFAYYGWLAIRASLLFVLAVVVLLVGVMFFKPVKVDSSKFQAVFLTNGQVYFGHLENANTSHPTLTNIYYIRSTQQNPQTGSTDQAAQPQVSLVKLGNELHGPEDEMTLKSDQIIFWETLKNDSKVVQFIQEKEKTDKK